MEFNKRLGDGRHGGRFPKGPAQAGLKGGAQNALRVAPYLLILAARLPLADQLGGFLDRSPGQAATAAGTGGGVHLGTPSPDNRGSSAACPLRLTGALRFVLEPSADPKWPGINLVLINTASSDVIIDELELSKYTIIVQDDGYSVGGGGGMPPITLVQPQVPSFYPLHPNERTLLCSSANAPNHDHPEHPCLVKCQFHYYHGDLQAAKLAMLQLHVAFAPGKEAAIEPERIDSIPELKQIYGDDKGVELFHHEPKSR
jgi:hypothetical protein